MKYTTASVIALASVADALPHPQFSLPSFSMPSSLPTGFVGGSSTGGSGLGGLLGGLGGGSGFSIPSIPAATGGAGLGLPGLGGRGFSIPSIPSATDGAGISLPGFGGSGLGGLSNVQVTSTATSSGAAPTTTGSTGGSAEGVQNNGASCQTSTGGSTEDGVKNGNCCTDMTVIFARGTGEMGNMGTISGPPMVKAIRSKLGADKVTVQGVDYAASVAGNANLGADGGKVMAQYVQQALKQCPGTKIIVSGYSQGGMVVHNAFSNGVSASNVAGVVLFGDPLKSQALPGMATDKVKQFCGTSDIICGGGGDGGATGSHLSYGSSADSAATFAIQAAGLA